MRAQGQTRPPITGQEWLRPCSAARLNLDINAFKISENCIPCDFLTFQKSTLLFLCAPEFESKPALLDFVVEGRSCFGFGIQVRIRCEHMTWRCGNGRARPRHTAPSPPVNISKPERASSGPRARAARFLISWWQISQNCDPKICRHPPYWIFLIQDQGPEVG